MTSASSPALSWRKIACTLSSSATGEWGGVAVLAKECSGNSGNACTRNATGEACSLEIKESVAGEEEGGVGGRGTRSDWAAA